MNPHTLWLPTVYHYYVFGTVYVSYRVNAWECMCASFIHPMYVNYVDEGRMKFGPKEYTPT